MKPVKWTRRLTPRSLARSLREAFSGPSPTMTKSACACLLAVWAKPLMSRSIDFSLPNLPR